MIDLLSSSRVFHTLGSKGHHKSDTTEGLEGFDSRGAKYSTIMGAMKTIIMRRVVIRLFRTLQCKAV